jgi:hypothetical protein
MPLWEALTRLVENDAQKLVYTRIAPDRVDRAIDARPLEAGRHYFRLWLAEMFLQKQTRTGVSWYPAVHALVRLDFGSQRVEIPNIASAARVGLQQAEGGSGDVVARNFPLTPTVPFNGGTVDVDVGLVAIEGENGIEAFIQALGGFAGLLAVPQLSAALSVAQPLASAVQELLGAGNGRRHLGLHDSFAANTLVPGYIAVVRASDADVQPERLWVFNDQLCEGNSASAARHMPFVRHDHLLLRLEGFEQRDDWESLTSIKQPFAEARRALSEQNSDRAAFYLRSALLRALEAPELTRADRRRVVDALKQRFEQDQHDLSFSNAVRAGDATLSEIIAGAMSPQQALAQGEPTRTEIFGAVSSMLPTTSRPSSPAATPAQPADKPPATPPPESAPRRLEGRMPQRVQLGEELALQVRVALIRSGVLGPGDLKKFTVPAEGVDLTLAIHAPGFELRNGNKLPIHVPHSKDSEWALFNLKAQQPGDFTIEVSAYHDGGYLGTLTIQVTVSPTLRTTAPVDTRASIGVRAGLEGEVTLEIRYDRANNVYRYQFRGREFNFDEIISAPLQQSPQAAVAALVSLLNEQARNNTGFSEKGAKRFLRGEGIRLWTQLIPKELSQTFWDYRDRISRLVLLSSGDPIPWEAMYPTDAAGAGDGFLVEQFPVVRWRFGPTSKPKLQFSRSFFVLPDGSPASARNEIDELKGAVGGGDEFKEADPLLDQLEQGAFDLLHFACHNTFVANAANASFIQMGNQKLLASQITGLGRKFSSAPLIFMNACRTDGTGATYTEFDGWAASFLNAGANAFVGSLWEVRDTSARAFAAEFYDALLGRATLGEAIKRARDTIKDQPGDPTWLAYTLYGNPDATLG